MENQISTKCLKCCHGIRVKLSSLFVCLQVIGVPPKPAVVQTSREVAEHAFQPVTAETKKEPPPTFSQASAGSLRRLV